MLKLGSDGRTVVYGLKNRRDRKSQKKLLATIREFRLVGSIGNLLVKFDRVMSIKK
jgi:hypothetical protein